MPSFAFKDAYKYWPLVYIMRLLFVFLVLLTIFEICLLPLGYLTLCHLLSGSFTEPFNAFKRRGMYPNVSMCNVKRCVCCTHLCTKTTITSSVNGRQFSLINNNEMDWTSSDLINFIT